MKTTRHPNGQKKSEGEFKNGRKRGQWTYWNEEGRKVFAHVGPPPDGGELLWFPSKGQPKSDEGYMLDDGRKVGHWTTWHKNGQKDAEGDYKNGKEEGLWTYWYDGQKSREATFKNGKEEGLWTAWYTNGQKNREGEVKTGSEKGGGPSGR
jgi:antitoxin component YwqK of YwqJK toxin-antitoxin module